MKDWKWEGLDKDERILNNMLSLWSPYIELEDIEYRKATSNPSHDVEVSYDFKPFVYSHKTPEGTKLSEMLLYEIPKYLRAYPVMKNMNVPYPKARDLLSYGETDEEINWEVGHYYMGGGSQTPLIIYIDDKKELEDKTVYTIYVLNLFRGDGGVTFEDYKWTKKEGGAKPWFNVYKVPQRKLWSEYKLDITDWIDDAKRASFMNWNRNPL